jgi:hypothetical protein
LVYPWGYPRGVNAAETGSRKGSKARRLRGLRLRALNFRSAR